ncbi:MAG: response regulator [Deltaproteobacteria bacterium]|nr:response regulator [Deltaproteobacteria bacterium]
MKTISISLFHKALLAVALLLLPILITFLHGYRNNREFLKKHILDDLTVIAGVYEGQVYQFLEMSRRRVQDFSSDGMIRNALEGASKGRAGSRSLSEYLVRNKLVLDKTIKRIDVITLDGRVAASTDPGRIGGDVSREGWFISGRDGVNVASHEAGDGEKTEVAASAPLFSVSGKRPIGVIANFMDVSELDRLLGGEFTREMGALSRDRGGAKTMDVYIVGMDGRVIASSRSLSGAGPDRVAATAPVRRCLESGRETSGFYRNYGGVEVAGASMCLRSMGWVLLAEAHADDILAPAVRMRRDASIAAAVVAGMAVVLFAVFYRSVLARLRLLSDALKDVADGNYDVARPVSSGDEIGAVFGSFNKMANEIRRRTELLARSEGRYGELVNNLSVGIYRCAAEDGRFMEVNRAFVEMFEGESKEDVLSRSMSGLFQDKSMCDCLKDRVKEGGSVTDEAVEMVTLKGRRLWASVTAVARRGADGKVYCDGVIEDITNRKRLEEQLLQSQKMEAIGLLAGGIAHDFNNILTALIGYGNLLLMKKGDDENVRNYAGHILALSDRAAKLTQGLLAFGRKQVMNPRPMDLNDLVKKVGKILMRLIGEDIELWVNVTDKMVMVKADASQIEQVLMNLATNARDAMPSGGVLTLSTDTVPLDSEFIRAHGGAGAGEHAVISFSDTGEGMDQATKNRIFEPFFTTKEVGKGTGLGLSVAYGIINQHNGFMDVISSPGLGTKFNIYLPLTREPAQKAEAVRQAPIHIGKETVLLAEDNGEVRRMTKALLEEVGYRVVEARDGEEAVRKYAGAVDDIDIIVMDMVMPRKSGMAACGEIKRMNPAVKVLFTSGYDADITKVREVFGPETDFIQKPAPTAEFLKKIKEVLDR